jgi:predicted phosphodiesterase
MANTTVPQPSRLTWLHLSDFHLRQKTGWEQDVVLESMLRDIRARFGQQRRPDMIFISGDIAFAGKTEEYDLAEAFIRKLCKEVRLPEGRLFLVPGNHDIDLDLEEDAVVGARLLLKSANEVSRFLGNEGRRKTLFARQKAFRDFVNRLAPTDPIYSPASFSHSRQAKIGPINVHVLLLDSSWLAGGGPSDSGVLSIGERQVIDCAKADGKYLTFALMHHPFSWLKEFEAVAIQNRIASHADICLRGHVHSPDQQAIETKQGRLLTFTAGAGFETRTSNNSYGWHAIDLATGSGETVIHRLNYQDNRWDANESQRWQLVSEPTVPSDLDSVRTTFAAAGLRYYSFVTCLVAGLKAEVPYLSLGQPVIYVNLAAKIGDESNLCGDLILQLRHHFHWRAVWEPAVWQERLTSVLGELNSFFGRVDTDEPGQLQAHEQACQRLLPADKESGRLLSPVAAEIEGRVEEGDLVGARAVLDRWRGQGVLREDEARDLQRLEIILLIKEGNSDGANCLAIERMKLPDLEPTDAALAALCAHKVKDFPRAARLMHQALDHGIGLDSVKTTALAIAGAAGDSTLASRILGQR